MMPILQINVPPTFLNSTWASTQEIPEPESWWPKQLSDSDGAHPESRRCLRLTGMTPNAAHVGFVRVYRFDFTPPWPGRVTCSDTEETFQNVSKRLSCASAYRSNEQLNEDATEPMTRVWGNTSAERVTCRSPPASPTRPPTTPRHKLTLMTHNRNSIKSYWSSIQITPLALFLEPFSVLVSY